MLCISYIILISIIHYMYICVYTTKSRESGKIMYLILLIVSARSVLYNDGITFLLLFFLYILP